MKIKAINNKDALINLGFEIYEETDAANNVTFRAFTKIIPGTFRFRYELFVPFEGEVFGCVSGFMTGGGECLVLDDFLARMAFRAPEVAAELSKSIDTLIKNKVIEVEA